LIASSEKTEDPAEKLRLYIKISEQLKNNFPHKALEYAVKANEMALKRKDDPNKLKALVLMAEICRSTAEYKASLEYSMKARELAIQLEDFTLLAESHRVLGGIYIDLGDYQQASDHFFDCLKLSETTGNKPAIARALNNIGYLYFEQQNNDKALEYYIRALRVARETNDTVGISRGLNNVAAIHFELNRHDSAEKYILEAAGINIRIGQRLWEGINYLNLGEIKTEQHRYEDALKYYNMAADIFIELNSMTRLSTVWLNLSEFYSKTGNAANSVEYAEKAFEIGQSHHLKKAVMNAAEKLHGLYLKKKDLNQAYHYGMIHYQMKDSLGLEESMIKLTKLELQYDFEKKKQENQLVQQRKDFLIILLIFGLVLIIVLILLLLARQKIKARDALLTRQRLQDEVDFKNKELTINVMNLIRKNEIITEISNRLMTIEQEDVPAGTRNSIIRMAHDLQKSTDEDIWDEFELRFKQVNGEFYDRLTKKFPDLSPGDLKLCAFLRLNLSSKDICKMTGQQITSLEIARHRLRKKLGISNTQTNLVAFLTQI
jgi:tetratricopeptide (TPR) repeat protein